MAHVGRDDSYHAGWQRLSRCPHSHCGTPLPLAIHSDVVEGTAVQGIVVLETSGSGLPVEELLPVAHISLHKLHVCYFVGLCIGLHVLELFGGQHIRLINLAHDVLASKIQLWPELHVCLKALHALVQGSLLVFVFRQCRHVTNLPLTVVASWWRFLLGFERTGTVQEAVCSSPAQDVAGPRPLPAERLLPQAR